MRCLKEVNISDVVTCILAEFKKFLPDGIYPLECDKGRRKRMKSILALFILLSGHSEALEVKDRERSELTDADLTSGDGLALKGFFLWAEIFFCVVGVYSTMRWMHKAVSGCGYGVYAIRVTLHDRETQTHTSFESDYEYRKKFPDEIYISAASDVFHVSEWCGACQKIRDKQRRRRCLICPSGNWVK